MDNHTRIRLSNNLIFERFLKSGFLLTESDQVYSKLVSVGISLKFFYFLFGLAEFRSSLYK